MASWRDRLRRASFQDFEFLTDSHEATDGRRLVVHEFPGADIPEVEDMGRLAGSWRLNAYFIGPDYDRECAALTARLAQGGAAWLTHPWLGLLWVRAHKWVRSERNDEGGYCVLSIDFLPGGGTQQPTQDMADKAAARIRDLGDRAQEDYAPEAMSADGMTAFVAAVHARLETLRQMISLAALPLTWASQVTGLIRGAQGDLAALMATPAAYASTLRGLTDVLGAGADESDLSDTARPRVVCRLATVATRPPQIGLQGVAATDGAVRRNVGRESALRAVLLVTAAAQIALADYRAAGDRDAALAGAVGAIDALLPGLSDAAFQAAVAARTALIQALQAQDLAPAATRDVISPLPAAVLAHRLGVDEDVFMARNAVRHPLFVRGTVYG